MRKTILSLALAFGFATTGIASEEIQLAAAIGSGSGTSGSSGTVASTTAGTTGAATAGAATANMVGLGIVAATALAVVADSASTSSH